MRRRTMIRTALFLGSICMTAWQLPRIMERIDGVMAGGAFGLPAPASASDGAVSRPVQPDEIVVYSAEGKPLTAAEIAALKRIAASQAPINAVRNQPDQPIAPQSPGGAPVQIGAPDPTVDDLLKRIEELRSKDGGSL